MNDADADFAGDILSRLAETMPENPARATQVQRLVRRRQRRRAATRATVGLSFAAGIGLVVAAGTSSQPRTVPTATGPADTPPASTEATSPSIPGKPADPCADINSAQGGGEPDTVIRIKVAGTITAVDDASVTVSVDTGLTDLSSVTATFAASTVYRDGDAVITARPTLAVGGHVAIAAVQLADGSFVVEALAVNQPDVPTVDASVEVAAAQKQAEAHAVEQASEPNEIDGVVRIKVGGTITAVDDSSLTISVQEGSSDQSSVVASLDDGSQYRDGAGASTARPALAAGDHVGLSAERQPDGSYVVRELSLADPNAPDSASDSTSDKAGASQTPPAVERDPSDATHEKLKQAALSCEVAAR